MGLLFNRITLLAVLKPLILSIPLDIEIFLIPKYDLTLS
ncbi:hypothetical protein ES703_90010 [subsurface metagenome]